MREVLLLRMHNLPFRILIYFRFCVCVCCCNVKKNRCKLSTWQVVSWLAAYRNVMALFKLDPPHTKQRTRRWKAIAIRHFSSASIFVWKTWSFQLLPGHTHWPSLHCVRHEDKFIGNIIYICRLWPVHCSGRSSIVGIICRACI